MLFAVYLIRKVKQDPAATAATKDKSVGIFKIGFSRR